MYEKSNMETYITICKIDSQQGICCVAWETQTGALYQPRGVGRGGRWEGSSKGRGCMYTYGWFMLRFDRKQQDSVKQLSFNTKKKKKRFCALTTKVLGSILGWKLRSHKLCGQRKKKRCPVKFELQIGNRKFFSIVMSKYCMGCT